MSFRTLFMIHLSCMWYHSHPEKFQIPVQRYLQVTSMIADYCNFSCNKGRNNWTKHFVFFSSLLLSSVFSLSIPEKKSKFNHHITPQWRECWIARVLNYDPEIVHSERKTVIFFQDTMHPESNGFWNNVPHKAVNSCVSLQIKTDQTCFS